MTLSITPQRVRSLFVSDLHLGMRNSCAADLTQFLDDYIPDTLYLVGDIVDGWILKKRWRWPEAYNDFAQRLLTVADNGTRVILIPGNHDAFLRNYVGLKFGTIELHDRTIHEGADGKRYLVLHGDQFDGVVSQFNWLSHLGHWAYGLALTLNAPINRFRQLFGLQYWSLSSWGKRQVKQIGDIKNWFAEALVGEAEAAGVDGVICGHIHIAEMHTKFGCEYMNCGDWVESRTGIVEHLDGQFELVRWRRTTPEALSDRVSSTEELAHV